ncbi:MFS transporter [Microvirga thermotolerans]|uniref:MFS transporter n=1 Tax=Microvirga thermotolerans TaxID=2651334 RepID=A0A5P9K1U5_9HYPH|nr:MFS transporter [Microvirga thermotolerans]QFU17595.1 MFS transporter [Microvirga thermotolerans]
MSASLRSVLPTLLALLLGYGLMQMGNTLQGTLLSIRGSLEGFSPTAIGAVGAAFWAGIVFGSLWAGRVIALVGHTRTFAALAAVASFTALLHLLVVHPVVWIAARALTGFCFAGLFMVVESWLNGSASGRTRGQILSLYGMTGLVAGIGGQLLLPAGDPAGFRLFCVVSMIVSLALVPTALSRASAPALAAGETGIDLRRLYRQSPFGLVAAFLCGVTSASFFALGPLFAREAGLDTGGIAVFMACGTLGGFAMTWPLGWLSDRMDRRLVIIAAAGAAAAILLALLTFVPDRPPAWVLYICVAIFGGSVIPTYSIVTAHVNDMVRPGEFVAASGGLLIVLGTGSTAGPVLAGMAMSQFGPRGLAYTTIVAQVLIAAWGVYRIRRRAAPPEAQKESFTPEPAVPVGTELVSHP